MEGVFTKFKIFVVVLLLGAISIFAQTGSGKLAGKITDAQTGEPLIGANIIIENTNLGAASDLDGNYFILNITPGTYTVKISFVGYSQKTVQEVRVVAGITYELNETLTSGIDLDEIVVTDKKFFEEKSTNTVKVVDSDQIAKLPVRGVSNIASLQSGVVVQEGSGGVGGNATINVRGGRGSEVLYIVDGVPQNNLITGNNQSQVANNAIEQLAFQVGGYEAKYGQAQSGIINVTTKAGRPNYQVFLEGMTSEFTDDYGYNLYSASFSGPVIPGVEKHTFFASVERGWFQDANPRAKGWDFPSIDKSYKTTPNNDEGVWRYSARTTHMMGDWKVNLGVVGNQSESRAITTAYVKNSSQFFDKMYDENISFSGRVSQTLSSNTFWNINIGYRMYDYKLVNPFFEDDLYAYGDSTRWANELGVRLLGDGLRTSSVDENYVFSPYGRARGLYQRREQDAITADFDFTSQIANHLVEFGGGISFNTVRGYGVFAYRIAGSSAPTFEEKVREQEPYVFGYDITGQNHVDSDFANERQRPRTPLLAYAYLQDRFELEDLVLNVGLRMDYFDVKSYVLVDPTLPFAGGSDPLNFDDGDFKIREADVEFSPRIGLGFPVTETTVFHAQYGRFIQLPRLLDMYAGPFDYNNYISMEPQSSFNAGMKPEETTQYEIGFRQLIGNTAALNITAFYKNIRGLVNVQNLQWQRVEGGEILNAIVPQNSDFGTTKGFAFSLDVTQLSYFNLSAQYTYSIAEGTGSSQSSSQTAVFRNTDRSAPPVIAPLSFDQRHTGVVNIDFFVPKGELGFFELFNANFLVSFSSGRPYTPVDEWNIIGDNGLIADVKGYINSAYGPSQFRVDMRLEKTFDLGSGLAISPFLWVENLFDAENVVSVWRSTGDPQTTGWLNTELGKTQIRQLGQGYADDYQSMERTPFNYGIPRLIRVGVKVNFNTVGL